MAAVSAPGCLPAAAQQAASTKPASRRRHRQAGSVGNRHSAASSNARKARLASARAAAQLALPRYKVDEQGAIVPDVRAEAAIIYNPSTGQVLWAEKAYDQRSIASITKVMTAVCFLETNPDLAQEVFIDLADVRGANTTYLRAYEKVSVQNLLHLLLIASDNAAARTLARVSSYGSQGLRRADEREGGGTRPDEHALRRSVRPAVRERVVGLRHGAADHLRRRRRASSRASCGRRSTRSARAGAPLRIHEHEPAAAPAGAGCSRAARPGSSPRQATAWRRCCACPQLNQTVAVVVLGAKSNAGRFWETRHLFNWIAARAPGLMGQGHEWETPRVPVEHAAARRPALTLSRTDTTDAARAGRDRRGGRELRLVAALHRGGVERQRGDGVHVEHERAVGAPRVVGLHVPLADVAGDQHVPPVRRRHRRPVGRMAVVAVRAGVLVERPDARAAAARQAPVAGWRHDRQFGIAAAIRAVGPGPRRPDRRGSAATRRRARGTAAR